MKISIPFTNNKGKKRQTNEDEDKRESKHPRINANNADDSIMETDILNPCPSPPFTPHDDNEVSSELNKMSLNNVNTVEIYTEHFLTVSSTVTDVATIFPPYIASFLNIGKEIMALYKKAEHNKELCGFLLERCKCAMTAVRALDIKKTENAEFFSKPENLNLFIDFIECMKRIQNFIAEVSQLKRLKKYLYVNVIDENFTKLVREFEGYMNSLNFSFTIQSRDELSIIKNEIRQIKEILLYYGVSDDKQSYEKFFDGMDIVTEKNKEFQRQNKRNKTLDSTELEENEPLLDGSQYHKTDICPSKRIEKRTSYNNCDEFCFKEFSNNSSLDQSKNEETQIEIRRQVNILKELKNSAHIIRFSGVAHEDTKFFLVTEWMTYGNLHEYYTTFKVNINWKTKIKFALDICRGVAYLHECEILHHDIQSANILVNENHKVKIANFGLSKKFSDITRNITHNLENIRYMAPEKLLLNSHENNKDTKKKKVPYDSKCEIYSVGALLWEIAELKKPHSDLKSETIVSIRKRVKEKKHIPPFSDDVPYEWKYTVSKAMEFEPMWRHNISDICRDFYNLNEKYSTKLKSPQYSDEDESSENEKSSTASNKSNRSDLKILSVVEAIRVHKSSNGDKRLAWFSFQYHAPSDLEAKYWLGYYYYHEDIPELQRISKDERIRIAVEIFKETADNGNSSAQLRYGMCLWKGEGVDVNSIEALKYLKEAADSGNSAAMYIVGKAYWNGSNGIEQDRNQGAEYLKNAASNNHPSAKIMCTENNIL